MKRRTDNYDLERDAAPSLRRVWPDPDLDRCGHETDAQERRKVKGGQTQPFSIIEFHREGKEGEEEKRTVKPRTVELF